jgi:hypothetical protein
MIRSLLFLAFLISFIYAGDPTFMMRCADPMKVNHATGAGCSYYESTDGPCDGHWWACGERVVFYLMISTDSSYSLSTSTVYTLDMSYHPALKMKGVLNNCGASTTEASSSCVNGNGVQVTVSGGSIQLTKLPKSARVVIRLDFIIDCSQLGSDGPAVTLNSYKAGSSGATTPCSGVTVPFEKCSSVWNCDDGDACTTDVAGGCVSSRTCSYTRKNCDDGNVCTVDS